MKIAVLGAGNIGTTIGSRWQAAGHEVTYGVRNPDGEQYREFSAGVQSVADAIDGADATLIAVPGGALATLLETHAERLDGTLLIDATNNVGGAHFHQIALFDECVPAAHVYRAFSTLGWENFAEPQIDGETADLFYSGPDADSRPVVERLITDVGLRPVHVGTEAAGADLLDGITRLWFALALRQGHGRRLAFRTLGLSGDAAS